MPSHAKPFRSISYALVLSGLLLVVVFALGRVLRAQTQKPSPFESPPPRQHFLSGGERSEQVLHDILIVLKHIDDRLGRIEQATLDASKALQSRER